MDSKYLDAATDGEKGASSEPRLNTLSLPPRSEETRPRLERLRRGVAWAGITVFTVWVLVGYFTNWEGIRWPRSCHHRPTAAAEEFSWDKVEPSTQLVYHPCFGGFQCARLEVPMDWNRTDREKGGKVVVAITKLPAKVGVEDERYGGAVLVNPGGPGGSGVGLVLRMGRLLQTLTDPAHPPSSPLPSSSATGKYYDIIGFDPRGVNNTTPTLNCKTDDLTRAVWNLQAHTDGVLGSSSNAFSMAWARSIAIGSRCSAADSGTDDDDGLARYINTTPVVADMVAIIEAHGAWREAEARKWLAAFEAQRGCNDEVKKTRAAVLLRTYHFPGTELLNFWGFSYGSVLGATFASMHPHRINRVVLDGVVDARDYYATGWSTNLQDTDLLLERFFEYCHAAGPTKCPFAANATSPAAVAHKYDELLARLRASPLPVPGRLRDPGTPALVRYSDLKRVIQRAVYTPLATYPALARVLADLHAGDGAALAACSAAAADRAPRHPGHDEPPRPPSACPLPDELRLTPQAILCADGADISAETPLAFGEYWKVVRAQSRALGDEWAGIRLSCVGWGVRPRWRVGGGGVGVEIGVAGKGPLRRGMLWVGTRRDPVTPVRNARRMCGWFGGEGEGGGRVLEVDGDGHCSFAAPSSCAAGHVRAYFQRGEFPPAGTVCPVDVRPLVGEVAASEGSSVEDRELREVVKSLAGFGGAWRDGGPI